MAGMGGWQNRVLVRYADLVRDVELTLPPAEARVWLREHRSMAKTNMARLERLWAREKWRREQQG